MSRALRLGIFASLASNGSREVRIDLVRFTTIPDTNAKKFSFRCVLCGGLATS